MVVNFRVYRISQDVCKLVQISTFQKNKKEESSYVTMQYPSSFYPESLSLCRLNEFYALSLSMSISNMVMLDPLL